MQKGLIHISTGDGKEKTTAATGLVVRALGHGFRLTFASFFKKPDSYGNNEIGVLKNQGATVFTFSEGMPLANPQITPEAYHTSTKQRLSELQKFITENNTQLLILEEIFIAIKYGYISEEELFDFMQHNPSETELILTDRGATDSVKNIADYVTVLAKEKHPYDKGVMSRVRIEY